MPNINEIYGEGGNFIRTQDVKEGQPSKHKVKLVEPRKIGEDTKLAVDTDEDKTLVLNKTNAKRLSKLFGSEDYSTWVGKEFVLVRSYTTYAGNEVACLRVQVPENLM